MNMLEEMMSGHSANSDHMKMKLSKVSSLLKSHRINCTVNTAGPAPSLLKGLTSHFNSLNTTVKVGKALHSTPLLL